MALAGSFPRMLLIGPVTKSDAGLIGGATVSFGQLIEYLEARGIFFELVDTQAFPKGWKKALNIPVILLGLLSKLPGSEVVFLNSSRGGTRFLAPLVYLMVRLFGRKFVFRPFGGDIKDYTASYSRPEQWLFRRTVLQADLLFLQTRELMHYYQSNALRTAQLSTTRQAAPQELLKTNPDFRKRFIFIGHIKASKGVDEIMNAARLLPDDYTIHLYGPIHDEKYRNLSTGPSDHYRGTLAADQVLATLSRYDVLLLPTYYEGEGYPGVIIEAFSLGLPVISTYWKAIPELVVDGENGKLIQPRATEELVQAIRYFDETNYAEYSDAALSCFRSQLATDVVLEPALRKIQNLCKDP